MYGHFYSRLLLKVRDDSTVVKFLSNFAGKPGRPLEGIRPPPVASHQPLTYGGH